MYLSSLLAGPPDEVRAHPEVGTDVVELAVFSLDLHVSSYTIFSTEWVSIVEESV